MISTKILRRQSGISIEWMSWRFSEISQNLFIEFFRQQDLTIAFTRVTVNLDLIAVSLPVTKTDNGKVTDRLLAVTPKVSDLNLSVLYVRSTCVNTIFFKEPPKFYKTEIKKIYLNSHGRGYKNQ